MSGRSRDQAAAAATLAGGLAIAMLAGPWEPVALRRRLRAALVVLRLPIWASALATRTLEAYRDAPADRPRELAAFLQQQPSWNSAGRRRARIRHWNSGSSTGGVRPAFLAHPSDAVLSPAPASSGARLDPAVLAPLPDLAALARLLDLDAGELAWFADVRAITPDAGEPLRHYRCAVRARRGGGARVLEAPKPRLKEIQRRLLRRVLDRVPVHPAAHGSVAGRGVRTALLPHAGRPVVLRADLETFFAAIVPGRVFGVLRTAGLPEAVAHAVTGLTTTTLPRAVWRTVPRPTDPALLEAHHRLGRRLAAPHLPQGAPTSPALANLVAFGLDRRLAGLATSFGGRYTRYVDDLLITGERLPVGVLRRAMADIVTEEGFALAEHKSAVLRSSDRQRVLGAVINQRPTVSRPEYDALRAVLHNCRVRGWRSQVRDGDPDRFRARITGTVSWVAGLDPIRGARLRAALDAVDWTG